MGVRLTRASSQYLSLGSAFDYNADYTWCGWIVPRLAVTNNRTVMVVFGDGLNYDEIVDDSTSSPGLSIRERRNGTLVTSGGTTPLVVDSPMFVAMVRSGGGTTLSLYMGATPDTVALERTADANAGTRALASSGLQFGERQALDAFYIDAEYTGWRAWTRALTLAELQNEAAQIAVKYPASLWATWPFLVESGAISLKDYSTNARDLTGVLTPTISDNPPIPWGGAGPLVVPAQSTTGQTMECVLAESCFQGIEGLTITVDADAIAGIGSQVWVQYPVAKNTWLKPGGGLLVDS